ncbi:protease SohB [Thioflexithrix psekupsensis]|uniref:Protease SohB n=1 Tax=Thioflexithrix psekupsensis TaxID=1570016 RepID=A0A251X7W1_9GAMM|nr:protease SohB [Thioflexithrix psekupsensis]OUD14138.1 protease SohB [Thioflexithrix psekupsensis]
MWEFLFDYGLFFAKTLTIVLAIVVIIVMAMAARQQSSEEEQGELKITSLSERFKNYRSQLEEAIYDKQELKNRQRDAKKQAKEDKAPRRHLFVLDFHGDIRASAVESLRQEITAILMVADKARGDEVVVKLDSGGGLVHTYGLAASQLKRIKDKDIPLTIVVDKVAASGGYLMACLADKLIAAPFAIIGSIGVLAQLPNFHRLLKKHDIDFEQLSAGEYKRTLTVFGENTDKARVKMQADLEDTHQLFKQFILDHRPTLNIEQVATGEYWYGTQAKNLNLIDDITTSDDYLLAASKTADIYQVHYAQKRSLKEKLGLAMQEGLARLFLAR